MIYLSPDWLIAASTAVAQASLDEATGPKVWFGYTITDLPTDHPSAPGPVRYAIGIEGQTAALAVDPDQPASSDVRLTMTYEVANAIATGAVNGARAFLDGRVKVGGNIDSLIERGQYLAGLNLALANL